MGTYEYDRAFWIVVNVVNVARKKFFAPEERFAGNWLQLEDKKHTDSNSNYSLESV